MSLAGRRLPPEEDLRLSRESIRVWITAAAIARAAGRGRPGHAIWLLESCGRRIPWRLGCCAGVLLTLSVYWHMR